MNRILRSIILSFTIFIFVIPSLAQKLPTGAYQANRERSYDIIHYKAELSFDFEKKSVSGKSTIRLTPLRQIDNFALDAIHLEVKSVTSKNVRTDLSFRESDTALEISLAQAKSPRDTFSVAIEYECQPKGGMYFRRNQDNPQLFYVSTYGENGLHANWLPIYNDTNDKFSTEMIITVPSPYVVISNGKLVANTNHSDGLRTYHWLQTLPHPNYLISIYVGDYERGDLPYAFGTIPLSYWGAGRQAQRGRLCLSQHHGYGGVFLESFQLQISVGQV